MKKLLTLIFVLVFLWSCEAIFLEDISNKTVVLIAPDDGSEIDAATVSFNWQALDDATTYQIQVARPNFEIASQIVLDSTISSVQITKDISPGEFQWRVKALNSEYETAYTTSSFSVIDPNFETTTVNLLTPIDNSISNTALQTLVWQTLENATEYRLQIWNPDEDGTKIKDVTVTTTNYEHNFTDGSYTWKVRGETATKNTVFSSRKITIDTTAPNVPTLDVPTDETTIDAGSTIDFKWTRSDIAGTEEIDSLYIYSDIDLEILTFKDKSTTKELSKDDLAAGDYYWVVKAFDAAGNTSALSTTNKLTIN